MMPTFIADAPSMPPSLVSSVLQSMPDIFNDASLASVVLTTVLKASRRVRSLPFIPPVLIPITAVALVAESAQVRHGAAVTCVCLVSRLVSRDATDLAAAYVVDLTLAAQLLIEHDSAEPLSTFLSNFVAKARCSATSEQMSELDSIGVIPVPVSPQSLEALLLLLAACVSNLSISSSQPSHEASPKVADEVDDALSGAAELSTLHLWRHLGGVARAAVLNLASSHVLLSGRCGSNVMLAAACVLERAFDLRSGCVVPASTRRRLAAIACAVLMQRDRPNRPYTHETCEVLIALYRISRLCSPTGLLSATIWCTVGIHDAVSGGGDLSNLLLDWSRNGQISDEASEPHGHFPSSACFTPAVLSEPARKKLRRDQQASSFSGGCLADSIQGKQAQDHPASKDGIHRSAVEALRWELEGLEGVSGFDDHPRTLVLLRRVVCLTTDFFISGSPTEKLSRTIHEWVAFVKSASVIIKDVLTNIKCDNTAEMWDALLKLGTESIRMMSALQSIKKLSSNASNVFGLPGGSSIKRPEEFVLSSAMSMLVTAGLSLDANPDEMPLRPLSYLLLKFSDAVRALSTPSLDQERLSELCHNFQAFCLRGIGNMNPEDFALLLKSSFRLQVLSRASQSIPSFQEKSSTLSAFMTEYSGKYPELVSACLLAKADLLCASVGCNGLHCSSVNHESEGIVAKKAADLATWSASFKEVSAILKGTGADELIGSATHCLGVLVFHAPPTRAGEAAAVLAQALWHPTSQEARNEVTYFVSALTADQSLLEASDPSHESAGRDVGVIWPEDSLDAPETIFSPKGDGRDLLRVLGLELQQRVVKLKKFIADGDVFTISNTEISSILQVIRIPSEHHASSKAVGLAYSCLIAIALAELNAWRASIRNLQDSTAKVELERSSTFLKCQSWKGLLKYALVVNAPSNRCENCLCSMEKGTGGAVSASSYRDIVRNRTPIASGVANMLNARMNEWVPFALRELINDNRFAEQTAKLTMYSEPGLLWKKVPRYVVGHMIRRKDAAGLEALAVQVNRTPRELISNACADSIARAAVLYPKELDLSSDGPQALLNQILQQPVQDVLFSHAGKVVQRVIMEVGRHKAERVRAALESVAAFLDNHRGNSTSSRNSAGLLISSHFMLVMDAVNRGLFHSKAPEGERHRYLRMLDWIIGVGCDYLHLYIPKVLATLKLALDTYRGNLELRGRIINVWSNFLMLPTPKHLVSHLCTILSILVPFVTDQDDALSSQLCEVVYKLKGESYRHWSEVVLLLRLARNASVRLSAQELESHVRPALKLRAADDVTPRLSSSNDLATDLGVVVETTEDVARIVTQHENGQVEVMASEHLLHLLRRSRKLLDEVLLAYSNGGNIDSRQCMETLASLPRILVRALTRSRNPDCQEILMQCIGEVGALDPSVVSRFDTAASHRRTSHSLESRRPYPRNILPLIALLLDDFLAPALSLGEKRGGFKNQANRVGLVIQELLRICGCKKDTADRACKSNVSKCSGERTVDWSGVLVGDTEEENAIFFWENLRSTTKQVVKPYLEELFNVDDYKEVFGGNAGDVQLVCEPVWLKVRAVCPAGNTPSAQDWRRQMVVQLVDYVGNQGKFGETLKALRPILRYEDNITAFIFPLAVVTALDTQKRKGSSELEVFLGKEISLVLRDCAAPQPVFDLFDTLRHWREERCYIRGRAALGKKNSAVLSVEDPQEAVKRKACIHVSSECERRKDAISPLVDLDGGEAEAVSLLNQAKAAYKARSFARAVMLAEYHIRNLRTKRGFTQWPAFVTSLRGSEGQTTSPAGSAQRESFSILQKCFAELEDAESMAGIASLRSETSLADTVIDEEATRSYDKALVSYERAIAEEPRSEKLHSGFLRCLMTLGHWETMLSHAEGLTSSASLSELSLRQSAQAYGIDAAWRLKRWDKVIALSSRSVEEDGDFASRTPWALEFNRCFGRLLFALQQRKLLAVKSAASEARRHLLSPVVRLAREGYQRAYPVIVLLQTVSEVEDAMENHERLVAPVVTSPGTGKSNQGSPARPLVMLCGRVSAAAQSLRSKEPLLTTRRICFETVGMLNDAAGVTLELARVAHVSGNLRAALACAYKASKISSSDERTLHSAVVRIAQIRHKQGDAAEALIMIRKEIERLQSARNDSMSDMNKDLAHECADRLCASYVLAGRWLEGAKSESSEVIKEFYQQAVSFGRHREEPFYALGRYFDTLLQARGGNGEGGGQSTEGGSSRSSRRSGFTAGRGGDFMEFSEYVPVIIRNFASALCNGHSRLYDAMPRMLTVWFDYHSAAQYLDPKLAGGSVEDNVKREIKRAFDSVPSYMWMTAVPQLWSRVLHPRRLVKEEVTTFLARLICLYPDQTTWLIWPARHLKNAERKKAATQVMSAALLLLKKGKQRLPGAKEGDAPQEQASALLAKMNNSLAILRGLVAICTTQMDKNKRSRSYDFTGEFRSVKRYLEPSVDLNPMMPTLEFLTVRMPTAVGLEHRPFGGEPVRMVDLENMALVMSSAMKPRRITLVGSDGRKYRYLAKQETSGDMRKDSRLVEFIIVVNRLLSKDAMHQRRELALKTYAVLPLTEEAGMIEWVDDLTAMRGLVQAQHKRLRDNPDMRVIQMRYQKANDRRSFLEWAMKAFPPALDRHFLENFGTWSDPHTWLDARNMWTQSVAVWSMVGYIVGLGDRHGENILIDENSGRCVHVDFAMLFDKGAHLRVPEIVPFRLTPNMVGVMGVAGYEGVFRSVAEVVLGILRDNTEGLMGVLEGFLYDPLADWGKSDTKGKHGNVQVTASKEAWQMRAAVKAKLAGMMDDSELPLSIKGQVQRLIHEATSIDNLCKMYIWWSGWI